MTDRELMQQALEALDAGDNADAIRVGELMDALRERLARDEFDPAAQTNGDPKPDAKPARQEQEQCKCCADPETRNVMFNLNCPACLQRLQYEREWVGLSEGEREGFWRADEMTQEEWSTLFDEIEAKLREKNK